MNLESHSLIDCMSLEECETEGLGSAVRGKTIGASSYRSNKDLMNGGREGEFFPKSAKSPWFKTPHILAPATDQTFAVSTQMVRNIETWNLELMFDSLWFHVRLR